MKRDEDIVEEPRTSAVAVLGDWSWSTVEVLGRRRGMVRVWSADSSALG